MIKYKLICKNCDFKFDSWFASSAEYEKLKIKKFLNCHNCNSKKIEKTLMAPKLINRSDIRNSERKNIKLKEVKIKIKEYQARSIHYNQKKKSKGIYGTASKKELKELKEEGIEAELIPWVEDKSN